MTPTLKEHAVRQALTDVTFYVIKCICQHLTHGCHSNSFPPLNYQFGKSTITFYKVLDVSSTDIGANL